MKSISHRAHAACNETGEGTGTSKVGGRSSSHSPDRDSERNDCDERNRNKAFQPLISCNHLVPMRAGRESEADRGKQYDDQEWHGDQER